MRKPINRKLKESFETKTSLGYPIVSRFTDGRREYVIVKRKGNPNSAFKGDFVVGVGYDKNDGTWGQGYYGFDTKELAMKELKQRYGSRLTAINESRIRASRRRIVENKNPLDELKVDNVIEFPNGEYMYVGYKNGKLFAGDATNTGIIPRHEIKYDEDFSLDVNLQSLYDKVVEDRPELEEKLNERMNNRNRKHRLVENPVDDLSPRFDSGHSFYNKAKVYTGSKGNENKLYSYNTLVAELVDGRPVIRAKDNELTQTTVRHIKEWLRQLGFKAETKEQIIRDYRLTESVKNPKTKSVIVLQGNYGYGWDDLVEYSDDAQGRKESREDKATYENEEKNASHRIIYRRVPVMTESFKNKKRKRSLKEDVDFTDIKNRLSKLSDKELVVYMNDCFKPDVKYILKGNDFIEKIDGETNKYNRKSFINYIVALMKDFVKDDNNYNMLDTLNALYLKEACKGKKKLIKEEFNPIHEPTKFWGVEDTVVINHGEWADPELFYKGYPLSYFDAVDYLWDGFEEECKEAGIEPDDNSKEWEEYAKANVVNALEDLVFAFVESLTTKDILDEVEDVVSQDNDMPTPKRDNKSLTYRLDYEFEPHYIKDYLEDSWVINHVDIKQSYDKNADEYIVKVIAKK